MLGSIIGAGASLLGGILGQKSQEKQADKNIALQKEFAQSGIQWKVADAKAAGVHPLYALGANTHSFAPVSIGSPLADGISKMGQNLARAADASATHSTKASVISEQAAKLQLDNMALQNQLLASQIARVNQAGQPPAQPSATQGWIIDGQGNAALAENGAIKTKPWEMSTTAPGGVHEPWSVPDVGFTRTPTGLAPVYSEAAKQRLEDDTLGMVAWNMRNRVLPMIGRSFMNPPPEDAGEGHRWMWNPIRQEYYRAKVGRGGIVW